ncbi:cbb3-type cytochrome oxidase assembly protein CcoS [Bosea rubneri]|uniref:Cbb3-type cytochrome oxidase assembly protein CcoS n=1 Tax=Bosea rubneri TaxID=3075434 RepID=A0ABU3S1T8_9HYPH|nr:cbb3-type cytochrome oxidase assembly protein CcoS [Bosea sp. ZW T0_25]MDU0338412.1 cbb3-type cytochrome oxidase assembly protein CcoS [Bosea sp. ZW T0_25]
MMDFFYLIPIALALGVVGLGAFMWSLRSGQYEDLDGAAARILLDDEAIPPAEPASERDGEAAAYSESIVGPPPPEAPPRPR